MRAQRTQQIGVIAEDAKHRLQERFGETPARLRHVAFEQMYGSTAGPFGGVGGCAMTTFEMDAFAFTPDELGVEVAAIYAAGRFVKIARFGVSVVIRELESEK